MGNCFTSTLTSFWIEKDVFALRSLRAFISPSLTTAKTALPDFSLSFQPDGTPAASMPDEKSAITVRSAAQRGAARRTLPITILLTRLNVDMPSLIRQKNPHLFGQAGAYFRRQKPVVRKQTSNLKVLLFLSSVLFCLSSGSSWSGRRGSNPRHQAWEACTLPAELRPHIRGVL